MSVSRKGWIALVGVVVAGLVVGAFFIGRSTAPIGKASDGMPAPLVTGYNSLGGIPLPSTQSALVSALSRRFGAPRVISTTLCNSNLHGVVDQWNDLSIVSSGGNVRVVAYNAGGWDATTGLNPAPPDNPVLSPIIESPGGATLGTTVRQLLRVDSSAEKGNGPNYGFSSTYYIDRDYWEFNVNRGVVSEVTWYDANC
jgi:hypothetical protein